MSKRRASASDAVVGKNIEVCRLALRMSQPELGEAIGVSFQKVQKYEKGTKRVGSGRLVLVAQALQIPVAVLLKGVPGADRNADARIPGILGDRLRLARAIALIDDTDVCRNLMLLTESFARLSARGQQPDLAARHTSSSSRRSVRLIPVRTRGAVN
jgi:transcriptional regulator with XRE-family HTH domain